MNTTDPQGGSTNADDELVWECAPTPAPDHPADELFYEMIEIAEEAETAKRKQADIREIWRKVERGEIVLTNEKRAALVRASKAAAAYVKASVDLAAALAEEYRKALAVAVDSSSPTAGRPTMRGPRSRTSHASTGHRTRSASRSSGADGSDPDPGDPDAALGRTRSAAGKPVVS